MALNEEDRQRAIRALAYWQACERFNLPRVPRDAKPLSFNALLRPQYSERGHPAKAYIVYVGIYDIKCLLKEIMAFFPVDEGAKEAAARESGSTYCLQLVFSPKGRLEVRRPQGTPPNPGQPRPDDQWPDNQKPLNEGVKPLAVASGFLFAKKWAAAKAGAGDAEDDDEGCVQNLNGLELSSPASGDPTFVALQNALEEIFDYVGWRPEVRRLNDLRVQPWFGDPSEVELSPGSFFLEDLAWVRQRLVRRQPVSEPLERLFSTELLARRLATDPREQMDSLKPSRMPPARWPAEHPLFLSQQVAVNEAFQLPEGGGLFSVNGPPGTGKTTLLRDLIAAIVCRRAEAIATMADPSKVFTFERGCWRLHAGLCGHEIVVASSNNNAVEIITKELPAEGNVPREWIQSEGLNYFRSVATRSLNGQPAWGLVSVALGNAGNRTAFAKLLYPESGDEAPTLATELAHLPAKFQEAKDDFLQCLAEARALTARLESANVLCQAQQEGWERLEMLDQLGETHRVASLIAPSLFKRVFARCRLGWNRFRRWTWARNQASLDRRLETLLRWAAPPENAGDTLHVPGLKFWRQSTSEREKTPLWHTGTWGRMRGRLFLKALKLHQQLLQLNREAVTANLRQAQRFFTHPRSPADPVELWRTIFLIVPVVSTTFASMARAFSAFNDRPFGWLLVDEAGQASPASAVGAMQRAKRVVVIGDPLQIPPVTTIPESLNARLMTHWAVDPAFDLQAKGEAAVNASIQTVSDRRSTLGAYLGMDHGENNQRLWVGCPLRVHRRCLNPMFEISNRMAYGGAMVFGTPQSTSEGQSYPLGPSAWYDVPASVKSPSKVNLAETRVVLDLLHRWAAEGADGPLSPWDLPVYVISPFVEVINHFRNECRYRGASKAWTGQRQDAGPQQAGTIHTFQGKEAGAVFLLLGGNRATQRAIEWAAATPNLLNVALTRAKDRFYVVGDRDLWLPVGVFKELASLEVRHHSPTELMAPMPETEPSRPPRLYVFAPMASKGLEDFCHACEQRPYRLGHFSGLGYHPDATLAALGDLLGDAASGDALAIVRGGGNIRSDAFAIFNDPAFCAAVEAARNRGLVVVTGIGHARDRFRVEDVATHRAITPTEAGYLLNRDWVGS